MNWSLLEEEESGFSGDMGPDRLPLLQSMALYPCEQYWLEWARVVVKGRDDIGRKMWLKEGWEKLEGIVEDYDQNALYTYAKFSSFEKMYILNRH